MGKTTTNTKPAVVIYALPERVRPFWLLFPCCVTRDGTQGLTHTRQVLYWATLKIHQESLNTKLLVFTITRQNDSQGGGSPRALATSLEHAPSYWQTHLHCEIETVRITETVSPELEPVQLPSPRSTFACKERRDHGEGIPRGQDFSLVNQYSSTQPSITQPTFSRGKRKTRGIFWNGLWGHT